VNTTAFVNAATNLADKPGGPGVIINVPSFDFGVLSTDDLPRGIYAIGIACTKGPPSPTQLDRFWSARLDLGGGEADAHSWAAPVGDATPSSGATNAPGAPAGHASSPATEQGPPAEALGADGVGSAKDAGGGGAESPTIANARVDGDTPAAPNFGGPPTFTLPATEIASHLTVDGNMAASLLLWLALAVAFGRIAVLLARISTTTAVVMP
jgi:hypothetical protein